MSINSIIKKNFAEYSNHLSVLLHSEFLNVRLMGELTHQWLHPHLINEGFTFNIHNKQKRLIITDYLTKFNTISFQEYLAHHLTSDSIKELEKPSSVSTSESVPKLDFIVTHFDKPSTYTHTSFNAVTGAATINIRIHHSIPDVITIHNEAIPALYVPPLEELPLMNNIETTLCEDNSIITVVKQSQKIVPYDQSHDETVTKEIKAFVRYDQAYSVCILLPPNSGRTAFLQELGSKETYLGHRLRDCLITTDVNLALRCAHIISLLPTADQYYQRTRNNQFIRPPDYDEYHSINLNISNLIIKSNEMFNETMLLYALRVPCFEGLNRRRMHPFLHPSAKKKKLSEIDYSWLIYSH